MAILDKLGGFTGPEGEKWAVNTFHSALYEFANGQVTKQQLIDYFGMDAQEQTELDWIIDRYNAQPTAAAKEKFIELMRVLFILAEANVPGYTTNAELTARIEAI